MDVDDSKIVDLFWQRSEEAIANLAEKYGSICRTIAWNILKDRLDAEECVNDAYLGVWDSVPPHRPDPLSTYLYRIVRNRAVTRYHANTARKRNSHYDTALSELEECIASPVTVEDAYQGKELTAALDRFLGEQDEKTRVMFVRRYWYADPVKDIAKSFRMTPNAVSVQLLRTRDRLKSFLQKEGYSV